MFISLYNIQFAWFSFTEMMMMLMLVVVDEAQPIFFLIISTNLRNVWNWTVMSVNQKSFLKRHLSLPYSRRGKKYMPISFPTKSTAPLIKPFQIDQIPFRLCQIRIYAKDGVPFLQRIVQISFTRPHRTTSPKLSVLALPEWDIEILLTCILLSRFS